MKNNSILGTLALLVIMFISCEQQGLCNKVSLLCSDNYIIFPIDDNVRIPQQGVYLFKDDKQNEYMSFQNGRDEILIYDMSSRELIKRVVVELEGSNGVPGRFGGYYIQDFEHIYVPSLYTQLILAMDTTAKGKQKIHFQETDDGEMILPLYLNPGLQMHFIDGKLYAPQLVNPMYKEEMMEKSRICLCLDTLNQSVQFLPMKFPPLITHQDVGTTGGFGANYSSCFDGDNFLYAFSYSDQVYRVAPDHEKVEEVILKSKYIDKVEVVRVKSDDMLAAVRATGEYPSYGNLVYDSYRKVYYRFAYPRVEIEPDYNPFDIISSGRKAFSIMVLNKELEIIGETLFPEYTYNPNIFMVLEDGLYLSTNHIKNPNYSDDKLEFQRIDIVEN